MLSSGHQQLGLDVLVSKRLWGKRTVNSSRLCRCAPGHHPSPAGPKECPQIAGSPRASCAAGLWGLGFRSSLWGVLSRSGLALGSPTHLHPAALAGVPVEHRMWTKPRLSPVEPSAMAAALPGSHWAPTRRCHGPISLLTETLGPGPAPSTATPVSTPQRPARQTQCWHLRQEEHGGSAH